MVTLQQHGRDIDDLTTLAVADLNRLLNSLQGSRADVVRDTLLEVMPELLVPYVTAAGELSAVWYEDLRAAAVGGSFTAITAGDVAPSRIDALVRWGVKPLYNQSDSTPLSLLGGGMQRIIAGADRSTIEANARKDVVSTSWSRVARPDACAWCRMLAGRGDVYRSADAAGMVIGSGVDPSATAGKRGGQGKGVKARGKGRRDVGSVDFHDFCRCRAEPTFYRVDKWVNPRTGREEKALFPIN